MGFVARVTARCAEDETNERDKDPRGDCDEKSDEVVGPESVKFGYQ